MRIVYFLPDVDAGVSRIVKTLLKYRRPNKEITYAVVLFRGEGGYTNTSDDDFNADEIIRFRYKREENAWSVFKRVSTVLSSDKDIIVGNDGFEIKMVTALKLKNPVVYIMHGDFPDYYSIAKLYHPVIDCFITYSNKIEQELKNILPLTDKEKVCKIYYPAASAEIKNNTGDDSISEKETFKILFAGLLTERKGADLLYNIYNGLLANNMVDFSLEIIGSGNLSGMVQQQFGSCSNVVLAGWQSTEYVTEKMKLADVFLFPSTLEGLPNVLVEALGMGAVPIASNLESGVADIIENGVNGILVEPGNVTAFTSAILSLYHNQDQLSFLKKNALSPLKKFEPYTQAGLYEQRIMQVSKRYDAGKRIYPRYDRKSA